MKTTKKIISILLVLIMALGMFTGCKKKATKSVQGDGKITVGIAQDSTIPDYDTNGLTVYLEEVTGLEIEFVYFANSSSNSSQQIALMCSGGETLPDVLLGITLGHYSVNQFGEDGYFADLSELLETNAPNYQKAMSKLPKAEQMYIQQKLVNTIDNKSIYAMPWYTVEAIDNMQSMMYINKTWLDVVGMQAPTNIAELEAVCKAFMEKDPNRNGKADEIPMLAQTGTYYYLLNAFCQYQNGTYCVDENGKVWDPLYTDEFRQGIQYVNTMVSKGYVNELGFTISGQEVKNLISPMDGTEGRVGIFSGHHESMTNSGSDILKDYIALGVLADETGKGGYNIKKENGLEFTGIITTDCADMEEAMLFLDAFYLDETVTRIRHGVKDVDWKYEEGKNAYGTDSYTRIINSQAAFDGTLNCTFDAKIGIQTAWNYLTLAESEQTSSEDRVIQASRLQKEAWEIYQNSGKQQAGVVGDLVYTSEEYDVREEKAGSLRSYVSAQLVLFMQGEKDPYNDKQWDEFTSTLTTLGNKEIIKIAQDAYTRKLEREAGLD